MTMVDVLATGQRYNEHRVAAQVLKRNDLLVGVRCIELAAKCRVIFRSVQCRILEHDEFKWPVKSPQVDDGCFPAIRVERNVAEHLAMRCTIKRTVTIEISPLL